MMVEESFRFSSPHSFSNRAYFQDNNSAVEVWQICHRTNWQLGFIKRIDKFTELHAAEDPPKNMHKLCCFISV